MFEAFQANKSIATGVVQWMLNSALPNMYWQLYDSYLMPNGAFYGAKKACEPLHLLYNYGNHSIYIINDHLHPVTNHRALIRVFDIDSNEVYNETADIHISEESSSAILKLPGISSVSTTYFLDLRLMNDKGDEIGNNFYWLSTTNDQLDYDAEFEEWPFYTPSKVYADYTQLHSMPDANPIMNHHFEKSGNRQTVTVTLENSGNNIAFFLDLNIYGENSANTILPVLWEDNYISLLPGETRKIKASFALKDIGNDTPLLKINGWNLKHNEN